MVLCDFLGRARALKAINSWNISPKHALAMNRHILVSHFGHLASLVWAKLILGRFRDAVLPDFSRFPAGSDDCLSAFFTDPPPWEILRSICPRGIGFVCASFVCYIARN